MQRKTTPRVNIGTIVRGYGCWGGYWFFPSSFKVQISFSLWHFGTCYLNSWAFESMWMFRSAKWGHWNYVGDPISSLPNALSSLSLQTFFRWCFWSNLERVLGSWREVGTINSIMQCSSEHFDWHSPIELGAAKLTKLNCDQFDLDAGTKRPGDNGASIDFYLWSEWYWISLHCWFTEWAVDAH